MRESEWKDARLQDISKKIGRCVIEMAGKGTCPKKNECMFPHLNAAANGNQSSKKKLCYDEFEQAGKCTRGPTCKFSHNITEEQRNNVELQRIMLDSKQTRKGICINEYRCQNSCLKGERCTYRHNISEQERKSDILKQKMDEKWQSITGQSNKAKEESLEKSTAIILIQEFRTLMKKFNKVVSSRHSP